MNIIPEQHTLLPCPLCGSSGVLDWSGVLEYSGRAWQYCSVACTASNCDHNVTLNTNSDHVHVTKSCGPIEAAVVSAWNSVAVSAKKV